MVRGQVMAGWGKFTIRAKGTNGVGAPSLSAPVRRCGLCAVLVCLPGVYAEYAEARVEPDFVFAELIRLEAAKGAPRIPLKVWRQLAQAPAEQGGDAIVPPVKREKPSQPVAQPAAKAAPAEPQAAPEPQPTPGEAPAQVENEAQQQRAKSAETKPREKGEPPRPEIGGIFAPVQEWLARANREYQGTIVKGLSRPSDEQKAAEQKRIEAEKAAALREAEAQQAVARAKAEAEAKAKAEAQGKADEAARQQAEAQKKASEEAARQQAEAQKQAAEEAAKKQAEAAKHTAEAAKRAEAEAKAEAAKKAEEAKHAEALRRQQEAHQQIETQKKAEEAARERAAAEKKATDEQKRAEAQAREEERKAAEAARAKEAEDRQRASAAQDAERKAAAEREAAARKEAEAKAEREATDRRAREEKAEQARRESNARVAAQKETAGSQDGVSVTQVGNRQHRRWAVTIETTPISRPEPGEMRIAANVPRERTREDGVLVATRRLQPAMRLGGHIPQGTAVKRWISRAKYCYRAGRKVRLPGRYTVARGDTLWGIAETHYDNGRRYPRIYRANRDKISDPDRIYPCQRFLLPRK